MGEHNRHKKNESECIQTKAYELWEKGGRKSGQDVQYWLNAEKTVKAQSENNSPKSVLQYSR